MANEEKLTQAVAVVTELFGITDGFLQAELREKFAPVVLGIASQQERLFAFRSQVNERARARSVTQPIVLHWLEGLREGNVDWLIDQAQRMERGIDRIIQINPQTQTLVDRGYTTQSEGGEYDPQFAPDGHYRAINGWKAMVQGEGKLYYIHFNDKGYRELGITQGFNVFKHEDPKIYRWTDPAFAKSNGQNFEGRQIWTRVEERKESLSVVGTAMVQNMDQFTVTEDSRYLNQLLAFFNSE